MFQPGDNVCDEGLGGIADLAASVQVHLGTYGKIKVAEASEGIAKAYLDRLTSFCLEGEEQFDGLNEFLVAFAHNISVTKVPHKEVAGVGFGPGVVQVTGFFPPDWGRNLPVMDGALQLGLPAGQAQGGYSKFPQLWERQRYETNCADLYRRRYW